MWRLDGIDRCRVGSSFACTGSCAWGEGGGKEKERKGGEEKGRKREGKGRKGKERKGKERKGKEREGKRVRIQDRGRMNARDEVNWVFDGIGSVAE